MPQNRKKLIELIIGAISNAIVHEILKTASENEEIASYYGKEIENAINISKRYKNKINPSNKTLPNKDIFYIRRKIIIRAKAELMRRITKGYKNIDLALTEDLADKTLRDLNIE